MEPRPEMVQLLLEEEREKMTAFLSPEVLKAGRQMLVDDLSKVELYARDADHARAWAERLTAKLIALDERLGELD